MSGETLEMPHSTVQCPKAGDPDHLQKDHAGSLRFTLKFGKGRERNPVCDGTQLLRGQGCQMHGNRIDTQEFFTQQFTGDQYINLRE